MGLLERVARLLRANINDLIDRAEDPEKILKQVMLDMQNQLLQAKTQLAIAVADRHLLEKKRSEHREREAEYLRQAELALENQREDLARAAAERAVGCRQLAVSFEQQIEDQQLQVSHLKTALVQLEEKLKEAQARGEILLSRQRRARAMGRALDAKAAFSGAEPAAAIHRAQERVYLTEALTEAKAEMDMPERGEDELLALDKRDQIDQILRDIKARRA